MDLRRRLADLDRLSRRPQHAPGARPSGEPRPATGEALSRLGLRPLDESPLTAWIREGREALPVPDAPLPDLGGFFTRAAEARPTPEQILFLDTETTGLAGGTGTIAFLLGVAWYSGGQLNWRQYLLPDFGAESAMLTDLAHLTTSFRVVMTYNGASFDLPLLRTRALLNRLPEPCADLVVWDLLVPGRRLWGRILADCRQQTLEAHLLDMIRSGEDIPGAQIPQVWFDFLRDGKEEAMARVLYHNQRDLVGMAGIFQRVVGQARRLYRPDPSADWREAWSLGRIAEHRRQNDLAAEWLLAAVSAPGAVPASRLGEGRFLADSVRILKRRAHWTPIRSLLEGALRAGLQHEWIHREAAILFEHRLGWLQLALDHARSCDDPHRVQRLEVKMARQQGRR